MNLRGYTNNEKEDRLRAEHTTLSPVGQHKFALDVKSHGSVSEYATDAVEAGSTTSVINATAHAALVGDMIRFTSGALTGIEADVISVSANTITLGQTLSSAPVAAVTFSILRPTSLTLTTSGGFASTVSFTRDGSNQVVTEDTVTPANNRPLPVKLSGVTGDITVTAQNLNVQSTHTGANPDSMQIGDGTETLSITASGQAEVAVTAALPAGTNNIGDVDVLSQPARSHTTDSIRIGDGTDLLAISGTGEASVAVTSALPAGTNNIGDVDVLSQPARSHTTDSIRIGDGTDLLAISGTGEASVAVTSALPAGTNNIGDVDVLSQPARSHTTDSMRIGDGTDLALVTGAGELNVLESNSGSILTSLQVMDDWDESDRAKVNPIVGEAGVQGGSGAVSASTQRVVLATDVALPAGTNTLGAVNVNHKDVVDFIDGANAILDASSTNIPGSGSSPVTLVASLDDDVGAIQVFDTTGGFIGIYTGAALSEILRCVVGPGSDQTIDVSFAGGARVSAKRLDSVTALSSGFLAINFIS